MRAKLFALLCAAAGATVAGGSCLKRPSFECAAAAECTSGNGAGFCVDGFCAFTDSSCPSGQRYGEHSGSLANQCVPTTVVEDAPPDQPVVPPDARECYGTGTYQVCIDGGPTGTVDLAAGTLDTDTDPRCLATQPADWIASGQLPACFVVGAQVTVAGALQVTGSRPLVLLGAAVTVNALLDGSSRRGQPTGPAANSSLCGAFPTEATDVTPSGAGGAGGTFITQGGSGGRADNNNGRPGGTPAAIVPAPTLVRGGCAGQVGGDGNSPGGQPGAGGGAVVVLAGTLTITNAGRINVSGAGGSGNNGGAGGGGGGSGGMIVLSADSITATGARLLANGGGGAAGSNNGGAAAEPGEDPDPANPGSTADGGQDPGGNGGDGFADNGSPIDATNGGSGNQQAGGGGGGGGGYIQSSVALTGAVVSPAAVIVP